MNTPRCDLPLGHFGLHHCIKELGHYPDTEHVCGCGWTTIDTEISHRTMAEPWIKCRCGCALYDHENANGPCLVCGCPEFREEAEQ